MSWFTASKAYVITRIRTLTTMRKVYLSPREVLDIVRSISLSGTKMWIFFNDFVVTCNILFTRLESYGFVCVYVSSMPTIVGLS